jgi:ABC-type Fe3+-siderophore transport system permease subunit
MEFLAAFLYLLLILVMKSLSERTTYILLLIAVSIQFCCSSFKSGILVFHSVRTYDFTTAIPGIDFPVRSMVGGRRDSEQLILIVTHTQMIWR